MTEVLSQDEIDQLLSAINAGDTTIEDVSKTTTQKKIRIYDFKRPSKFSKDQQRAIRMIYDSFARLSQTTLSAILRAPVQFHVASVDELTFEEFTRSIPTPTTMAIINMDPLKGSAIFEIDPAITFAIIDRIFGGKGKTTQKITRELTDIEQAVMENIIVKLLSNLRESWANYVDLRPRLGTIEVNPQFATIIAPTQMTTLVTLETKIGDNEGMSNFCIPALTLDPIIGKLTPTYWFSSYRKGKGSEYFVYLKKRIEDIPLTIKAELGSTKIKFGEILDLKVDDIIAFHNVKVTDDINIKVGNHTKFLGRPGVFDSKLSVQITKVLESPTFEDIFAEEEDNG